MSRSREASRELTELLEPLTADPAAAAVFFDLDGTLAPIVERPEDAHVPERTRELLARIGDRYGLAGIVTGRPAAAARRIVGLPSFTYIGNHGYELLEPGAPEPLPAPALAGQSGKAAEFAARLDPGRLEAAGLRTEDKGPIFALHWRGAADEQAAAAAAAAIAAEARDAGLHTHEGRKVIELRPPVEIDKGVGIAAAIEAGRFASAFYAGDDRTDLDAFDALRRLTAEGTLAVAITVAVVSEETPPEVAAGADFSVAGPERFAAVIEALG